MKVLVFRYVFVSSAKRILKKSVGSAQSLLKSMENNKKSPEPLRQISFKNCENVS